MIKVGINSQIHIFDESTSLMYILKDYLGIENLIYLAIAHNGEVVSKDQVELITVNDGDVLDIVQPVGGG
jgi:thiamine biosynthesis protein ThiS